MEILEERNDLRGQCLWGSRRHDKGGKGVGEGTGYCILTGIGVAKHNLPPFSSGTTGLARPTHLANPGI